MNTTNPSSTNTTRHFLQSSQWGAFQQALGHQVLTDEGQGWSYLGIVEHGYGPARYLGNRLYCPYGPSYTDNEALAAALAAIRAQAKKHGCSYIRVEPLPLGERANETSLGLQRQSRSAQPALTSVLDLTKSFDELTSGFTKTNRYLWRRQADFGLTLTQHYGTAEAADFVDMMAETARQTGALLHEGAYYQTMLDVMQKSRSAGLYYASHDGQRIAGMLFADDHQAKTRYYFHAGSRPAARKLNAMAIMLMHAIHDAQTEGMTTFDFFGVSPADQPNHRWAGFSKFKRSFGGTDRAYPGTFEQPVRRPRYALLQALRKLKG
ncbi:hypothetical protein CR970_00885 [Candidatus Saccharibacteria bacterium]|nr:MAG: hypothetical protein CR970_00885 [Candidatus Saccharibacteria bacterium]